MKDWGGGNSIYAEVRCIVYLKLPLESALSTYLPLKCSSVWGTDKIPGDKISGK